MTRCRRHGHNDYANDVSINITGSASSEAVTADFGRTVSWMAVQSMIKVQARSPDLLHIVLVTITRRVADPPLHWDTITKHALGDREDGECQN